MSSLLLDASVLLATFDSEDRYHAEARAIMENPDISLSTLDLARYETANVAVRAWRDPALVPTLLATIERIGKDGGVLASTSSLLQRAADFADQHEISVYDATYVAAAAEGGFQLVSCDHRDLVNKDLALSPDMTR